MISRIHIQVHLGLLCLLGLASAVGLAWQAVLPKPLLAAGLCVDRITTLFGLAVAGIGAVTLRYSWRAMEGDPARGRFATLLTGAAACAWVAAMADHLALMLAAWVLQGLALHGLLTIRTERQQAVLPARTSFLMGRLGDLSAAAACVLAWQCWGTMRISDLVANAPQLNLAEDAAPHAAIALLLAVAAITKSAQVPFHAWLPETMEAPTPVSALMHAGIVNAGGVLLVRCAPIVAPVPAACALLVVVGTATMLLAMPAMWAQVKVKRELAWSTVAQMGFMTVQCGLAAFPAAALHVVGHGCYKAWSFLRAGDVPPPPLPHAERPGHSRRAPALTRSLALLLCGALVAFPATAWVGLQLGLNVLAVPGECALAAVLALSVGQMWVAIAGGRAWSATRTAACAGVLGACAVLGPLAWVGMAAYLAPVIGHPALPDGPLGWALAALPVTALAVLSCLHLALPALDQRSWGLALHVHALNGFYLGTASDRLVQRVWPASFRTSAQEHHA